MTTAEVPDVVRALWGQVQPGRRGPKPAMSLQAIAAEGVALADTEGLGAVSMSAVAKRLGFTTMSLYRYVASRDDLETAMADLALGDPPAAGRRRWRGETEAWARAELGVLAVHPWVLDVRPGSPPLGPNTLGWMDAGLRALGGSGLSSQQAASCLLIVDGYVRNQVQLLRQFGDDAATSAWADQLRTVLDRDRMPTLAEALDGGAFDDPPSGEQGGFPGDEFAFGLALLLDGIERLAS